MCPFLKMSRAAHMSVRDIYYYSTLFLGLQVLMSLYFIFFDTAIVTYSRPVQTVTRRSLNSAVCKENSFGL